MVQHVVLIDPNSTSSQSVADADGSVQAAGVDGGGETVGGTVADADGVFFRLEFGDGADRAKDFFLHDLHVLADAREDGGLDEVTLLTVTLTADFDFGAFLLALFNIPTYWSMYALVIKRESLPHDAVILKLGDLWALECIPSEWIPNLVRRGPLLELLDEFVIDSLLHIDP